MRVRSLVHLLFAVATAGSGCTCHDYFDDDWDGYECVRPPLLAAVRPVFDPGQPEDCASADLQSALFEVRAHDTNAQVGPVVARAWFDFCGAPGTPLREWEWLNHANFEFEQGEKVSLVVEARRSGTEGADIDLLVAAVAPRLEASDRRPLELVFLIDSSASTGNCSLGIAGHVLRTVAAELRVGDRVSVLTRARGGRERLIRHEVEGPDDPALSAVADGLEIQGRNDFESSLRQAYELADEGKAQGRLARVFVMGLGVDEVTEAERTLIATHANGTEDERVSAVVVELPSGRSYDGHMPELSALGQGPHLLVVNEEDVEHSFAGDRFLQNLGVAAHDLRLTLRLPAGLQLVPAPPGLESVPADPSVPQPLPINDAALYFFQVRDCGVDPASTLGIQLRWTALDGGEEVAERELSIAEVLAGPERNVTKARALIHGARVLHGLPGDAAFVADVAAENPEDADLAHAARLLGEPPP